MGSQSSYLGPDWTDISISIRAIEEYHNCRVYVRVDTSDRKSLGELRVTVTAVTTKLEEGGRALNASEQAYYPSYKHTTFPGLVYNLLLKLDTRLGADLWQQSGLGI